MHFDDEACAAAACAFERAGVLHSSVTWHEVLRSRATQISSCVGAFRTKGGSGAAMSKAKMIGRCTELVGALSKTLADIFGDAAYRSTVGEMARLGLPQQLDDDAAELRSTSLQVPPTSLRASRLAPPLAPPASPPPRLAPHASPHPRLPPPRLPPPTSHPPPRASRLHAPHASPRLPPAARRVRTSHLPTSHLPTSSPHLCSPRSSPSSRARSRWPRSPGCATRRS